MSQEYPLPANQSRSRMFVELCCGSAAVTLSLLGGKHARPPISYMGSKRGYAHAILWAMGLQRGQGADQVLLCDAGPWAHVWAVLADPERCQEVAAILMGWKDEDPRALWERLRDEHRGEWDGWGVERAAGWLLATAWGGKKPSGGSMSTMGYAGPDVRHAAEREGIAHRLQSVAAWLQVGAWSQWGVEGKAFHVPHDGVKGGSVAFKPEVLSTRVATLTTGPVSIFAGPAETIEPPDDCDGVYMFCDPPYANCTGYAADMPRETVLATAQRWSDAGAVVCVSEAEPLELDGWHHLDITSTRQGQRRTFSRQQCEWLTMNRPPAWKPAVQRSLF